MTIILSLRYRSSFKLAKMQPSIRMFFKARQSNTTTETDGTVKTTPTKESVGTITKRTADDDDETTSNKRQAISSPAQTPTKRQTSEETVPVKTASPLIDVKVVIRKKISSGAFALHENIGPSWFRALQGEFDKPYFKKLSSFVQQERKTNAVFPPEDKVYSWTHHHDIKSTRVIIIGQDPYHGPGQAHGLSFSVQRGVKFPPSLINIFKELENDIAGFESPPHGDLTGWAKQGVLMLNTCLTVNQGHPNSHQNKGWETFTDAVISWISNHSPNKVVFLLWGRPAQKKSSIVGKRHKILTAAHPSPLSAHNGFFGCSHFSQTNTFLRTQSLPEIDWKAL